MLLSITCTCPGEALRSPFYCEAHASIRIHSTAQERSKGALIWLACFREMNTLWYGSFSKHEKGAFASPVPMRPPLRPALPLAFHAQYIVERERTGGGRERGRQSFLEHGHQARKQKSTTNLHRRGPKIGSLALGSAPLVFCQFSLILLILA